MKNKIFIGIGLILISIIGVIIFINTKEPVPANENSQNNQDRSAEVTGIIDKPNQAEDGYYEITAKDDSGQQYIIDATGYLNTPKTPESNGETCVDVPKVRVGDKISFNLPLKDGQTDVYIICHNKDLEGFYLDLIKI